MLLLPSGPDQVGEASARASLRGGIWLQIGRSASGGANLAAENPTAWQAAYRAEQLAPLEANLVVFPVAPSEFRLAK